MKVAFWVVTPTKKGKKELWWWFEHDIATISDVDSLIERLDGVGRTAGYFWVDEALSPEVKSLLSRIKPSLSQRTQILLEDLLVL